jgi:GNAT superfamily N-acetyltransferase
MGVTSAGRIRFPGRLGEALIPSRSPIRSGTGYAQNVDIRPLTPGRFADLAALFEEGGDPKWCWCVYFRFRGRDWTNSTAAQNRAALETLAERTDPAPGLIAYRDGRAVGWVSLGPREDYERIVHSKVLAAVDDVPVWSIVCFVVSRRARGQGVAAVLLDAAIDYARGHGATTLEAYPVDTSAGRIPAANAYRGALSMFERAGFTVVDRRQWNASTPVRPIVRLALERDRAPGDAASAERPSERDTTSSG